MVLDVDGHLYRRGKTLTGHAELNFDMTAWTGKHVSTLQESELSLEL